MKKLISMTLTLLLALTMFSVSSLAEDSRPARIVGLHSKTNMTEDELESILEEQFKMGYTYVEYPLEHAGISLHLDRLTVEGTEPDRNILLMHGVTYSSHEFDIDYEDYSLVRFLAREGYAVWRLDIAGLGQSEKVEDGFLPDDG